MNPEQDIMKKFQEHCANSGIEIRLTLTGFYCNDTLATYNLFKAGWLSAAERGRK